MPASTRDAYMHYRCLHQLQVPASTSHVTHMYKSHHTYEWLVWHKLMRHGVTHIHAGIKWVVEHISTIWYVHQLVWYWTWSLYLKSGLEMRTCCSNHPIIINSLQNVRLVHARVYLWVCVHVHMHSVYVLCNISKGACIGLVCAQGQCVKRVCA